jgi:hypothetical protein
MYLWGEISVAAKQFSTKTVLNVEYRGAYRSKKIGRAAVENSTTARKASDAMAKYLRRHG